MKEVVVISSSPDVALWTLRTLLSLTLKKCAGCSLFGVSTSKVTCKDATDVAKCHLFHNSVSKSPMCKLNLQKKWPHETPFTKEAHTFTLGLSLKGSSFGI